MTNAFSFFVTPGVNTNNQKKKYVQHYRSSTTLQSSNLDDDNHYDLIVLGAGPVGVCAACKAATSPFNKRVCLVDAPRASGVLMNGEQDLSIGGPTGLFSKALRDTSKRIKVSSLRGMGLRDDSIWNEVITSCIDLATANAQDIMRQLEFSGVTYVRGFASFDESTTTSASSDVNVKVHLDKAFDDTNDMKILKAKKVLVATGSKPFLPRDIPFDGQRIFDSDSINQLTYLPKSIVITGSGIIAVEYAKIFSNLGSVVTLVIRDNIPRNALMKIGLDKDSAATLVADLVRSGIHIERGAQVSAFQVPPSGRGPIKVILEGSSSVKARPSGCVTEVECDAYLAAVGRTPNTKDLNLQAIGIQVDAYEGIPVNSELQTTCSNVYAAGDVLGRPFLASTGLAQGVSAIDNMFPIPDDGDVSKRTSSALCSTTEEETLQEDELCVDGNLGSTGASFDPVALAANPFAFPVGVWSSPEAAYYGLSLPQAEKLGMNCGEGIALYAECLRGRVFSPNGLLKLVYDKSTERIIGVHICGDDACELVHYGMELVRSKRTLTEVAKNMYSAVTFHELYRIAAVNALDEGTARKRRAAIGSALAAGNKARLAKSRNA
eukprot:CAMPEP_0172415300 /NCGR_PEP_ID=MMETSP1064-20121228/1737_1 /TAXON_ID=202472 /ORGANISM="Aulacoseira subarctica , Strain CCAP 1002/5" /LENGTH=605 /DNA_ID=CAMNT_0013152237 /DNA_START=90 /DNA_END=1907 /DNA_ORIENTATION=+